MSFNSAGPALLVTGIRFDPKFSTLELFFYSDYFFNKICDFIYQADHISVFLSFFFMNLCLDFRRIEIKEQS